MDDVFIVLGSPLDLCVCVCAVLSPHGFHMFYDWPRGARVSSRQDHEPEPLNPKAKLGPVRQNLWAVNSTFQLLGFL